MLAPWKKNYDQPRKYIKKQRHYFDDKGWSGQSYGFPVVLYGCENWTIKKAECQIIDAFKKTVVLEETLESPLNCKEIQPVKPKGNQSWIFIGKTDAEAEVPILWLPNVNWLIGKDPDGGKDWRHEEKRATEDEIFGWHHQLNEHEFEQALGVGDGQESLACCSPWGCKESDTTERLNWTDQISKFTVSLEMVHKQMWKELRTRSDGISEDNPGTEYRH